MGDKNRVVVRLPLESLWNDAGPLDAEKGLELTEAEIKTMLRDGPIAFVVADVGFPLRWVAPEDCFDFWKTEGLPHLHEPTRPSPEDYPGGYLYFASKWQLRDSGTVVVLEKSH